MVNKPILLDLFCGAGGAARGYQRAGFYVVGVDNRPQPRYAGDEFVRQDALWIMDVLLGLGSLCPSDQTRYWLSDFDAIHASPPCQFATRARLIHPEREYSNLIPPTRERLLAAGLPYVIENVEDAREHLREPCRLCGSSFGLDIRRHRLFETNWPLMVPPCAHGWQTPRFLSKGGNRTEFGKPRPDRLSRVLSIFGREVSADECRRAMEMPWATREEIGQAIPPAYTELIGHQLMQMVRTRGGERAW